ncbi:MAG TPA: putative toxin-antitoxin system toxin component, PIN family [Terracidiphilus sp.]|jgi:putative PIN family toxin of toxin-antitoxin system|nr:putative toxin-antitoxin system toxin component, PIN family [Terracidiphilus sp.]
MPVVFDTSVWISAMQFGHRRSAPVLAIEAALSYDTIAICDQIEEEIFRILTLKFQWEPAQVKLRLGFLLHRAIYVRVPGKLRVCRDPNDDMVIECAVVAKARAIVSGDKDLLALGVYKNFRIVTPAGYLASGA